MEVKSVYSRRNGILRLLLRSEFLKKGIAVSSASPT